MKKVLVIFWEVPESIKLIELSVDEPTFLLLQEFNGHYINSILTSDEMADKINSFFYNSEGYFVFQDTAVVLGGDGKDSVGPLMDRRYDMIVQTGMFI
jgi:hypothetical protein